MTSAPNDQFSVSVVIPCFNRLDLTKACLAALEAAITDIPYEVILIDNASTDGTAEFMHSIAGPRCQVLFNAENLNFAGACNQGLTMARAPYTLLLNNDTEVTPGFLLPLLQVLQQEPDVGIVGSKLLYPDGTVQHAGVVLWHHNPGELLSFGHVYQGWPADAACVSRRRDLQVVSAACVLLPTELGLRCQGFDTRFRNSCDDIDLCLRMRVAGYRVVYEPASVVVHHESQTPGRTDADHDNLLHLFELWNGKVFSDDREIYQQDGYSQLAELAERCGRMRQAVSRYQPLPGVYPPATAAAWQAQRPLVHDGATPEQRDEMLSRHAEMSAAIIDAYAVANLAMSIAQQSEARLAGLTVARR